MTDAGPTENRDYLPGEDGPLLHPDADKFDPGEWERSGHCICGAALPAGKDWCGAGGDWSHVICPACGRMYVDEETFTAIYVDHDDFECDRCCPIDEADEHYAPLVGMRWCVAHSGPAPVEQSYCEFGSPFPDEHATPCDLRPLLYGTTDSAPACDVVTVQGRVLAARCGHPLPCPEHSTRESSDG